MRDLSELNINIGGRPVRRSPPTQTDIGAFQTQFGIELPAQYLTLLKYSNGGHPQLDSYVPQDESSRSGRWAVDHFYHLSDDRKSVESLWWAAENWRRILGPDALPIAADGGGNQFVLDLSEGCHPVTMCVHDENYLRLDLAPSFEAFIDGLAIDPDMI